MSRYNLKLIARPVRHMGTENGFSVCWPCTRLDVYPARLRENQRQQVLIREARWSRFWGRRE